MSQIFARSLLCLIVGLITIIPWLFVAADDGENATDVSPNQAESETQAELDGSSVHGNSSIVIAASLVGVIALLATIGLVVYCCIFSGASSTNEQANNKGKANKSTKMASVKGAGKSMKAKSNKVGKSIKAKSTKSAKQASAKK